MTYNRRANTDSHEASDDVHEGNDRAPEGGRPRKQGWFMVDNEFFRGGLAAELGPAGVTVYLVLRMHADNRTREAHPSYAVLQRLTGLSRTTVIKQVRELEGKGLIRVEARHVAVRGRGPCQTSHLYTILDGSGQEGTSGGRGKSGMMHQQEMSSPGIEPEVVQPKYQGSRSNGRVVVQPEHQDGIRAAPKHHSGNITQKEPDLRQQHQPSDDVVDVRVLLSSETWISEDWSLTAAERARFKRVLAAVLLRAVVHGFHNVGPYVKSLNQKAIDKLGTLVLWLSRYDPFLDLHLRNPSGFVRSIVGNNEWEEPQDYEDMPELWSEFCDQMTDVARGLITKGQLIYWLAGNGFNADIVFEIEEEGFQFQPDDAPIVTPDVDNSDSDDADWNDEDPPF